MSLSNFSENQFLDAAMGSTAFLGVNTLWVGLSTADPGEDASGLAEPSGNGYARVAMVNSSNAWSAAASGVKRNAIAVTFPTATGSWGSVSHFAIWTNATSNGLNVLFGSGPLGASRNVISGDVPTMGVGSLSVTIN